MADVHVYWVEADDVVRHGDLSDLATAVGSRWCWIDVTDPDAEVYRELEAPLGLHPLAVEDALHRQPRPKLDLYPEGPFLVWLTPHLTGNEVVVLRELDVFLGEGHLVTSHEGSVEAIDAVCTDIDRLMRLGPAWILHAIIDRLVDSLLPVVDGVGDQFEIVEDSMLDEPDREDLERLYALRRQLLVLHRTVAPERDIIRAIAREPQLVSADAYRYFDDIVDHLAHAEDSLESYRDIGSAVMDIYLSAQSNRLNEIMKVLTVVTVVIGALTLISGIYGMNLLGGMWPPPTAWWAFPSMVVVMIAVAAVMVAFFRRKKWW